MKHSVMSGVAIAVLLACTVVHARRGGAYMKSEIAKWGKVIRAAKIQAN